MGGEHAYLLVVAALLMLAGAAADRFDQRRLFLVGLHSSGLGSLLCSLAPNTGSLIGLRMLQGIGGSMLTPVSLSIVRNTFHDPRERAQALGVWSAIFGLATACGPIVGGVLVATIGWRSIFWLNVPICAVMMAATVRYVPESRASRPRAIDVPGQLLAIALLGSLTYAVIQGPASGWSSAWVIAATCVAAVSAAGFVAVERRSAEPLLELRFFRSRPFTGASVIAVASFVVLGGFLFVITLYLQQARGFSPLRRLVAAARHAGDGGRHPSRRPAHRPPRPAHPAGRKRPADRRGHGDAARPRARHAVRLPGAALAVTRAGLGLVNPPITGAAIAGMPAEQAGVASAVISATRQIGSLLGVAVMGDLVATGVSARWRPGRATRPPSARRRTRRGRWPWAAAWSWR